MRHAEAARPDTGTQVATGEGAKGGEQDVVRDVEPHEQPAPVGVADEAAVCGRDDLGGIVELSCEGVDFRASMTFLSSDCRCGEGSGQAHRISPSLELLDTYDDVAEHARRLEVGRVSRRHALCVITARPAITQNM